MRHLKSSTFCLAAAVTAAAFCPAAFADGGYVGLMGSYVIPDSDRATDNGYGLTLLGGVPLASGVNAELDIYGHQVDFSAGGGNEKSYGGTLDLRFDLADGSVRPFVLAGLGMQQDKVTSFKDNATAFDFGVGLIAGVFRGEVRAYSLSDVDSIPGNDRAVDYRVNLGFQFGGGPAVVAAAAPVVAEPAAAPAPALVEIADADKDGVADSADKCPNSARGAQVDASGCVNLATFVLKGVNFGTGSATLLPAAADQLKAAAAAMKANPQVKVEVDGYTDSMGDAKKNVALSEARAASVKAFLVKEGVDAGRMTTKGFGAENPADTNKTKEGRANNRRVAFKVL